MRFFFLPLLLIVAFQAFAAEPVLKFTLTKANGTPAIYEFLIPDNDTNQGVLYRGMKRSNNNTMQVWRR